MDNILILTQITSGKAFLSISQMIQRTRIQSLHFNICLTLKATPDFPGNHKSITLSDYPTCRLERILSGIQPGLTMVVGHNPHRCSDFECFLSRMSFLGFECFFRKYNGGSQASKRYPPTKL